VRDHFYGKLVFFWGRRLWERKGKANVCVLQLVFIPNMKLFSTKKTLHDFCDARPIGLAVLGMGPDNHAIRSTASMCCKQSAVAPWLLEVASFHDDIGTINSFEAFVFPACSPKPIDHP
jgi:hypothetical protein